MSISQKYLSELSHGMSYKLKPSRQYKVNRQITMNTVNLSIELPFKIGDKIWMDTSDGFGRCNFVDRYKKVKEVEVTSIEVRYNLKTNKQEIIYCVDNTGTGYIYNGSVAFTKEQYYENFRKEIEELIPEDLRNYLWKK